MLNFFAGLLLDVYNFFGNIGLSIAAFSAVACILLGGVAKADATNTMLSDMMNATIDKKRLNTDKKDKMAEMALKSGYDLLTPIFGFAFKAGFGVLLALSTKSELLAEITMKLGKMPLNYSFKDIGWNNEYGARWMLLIMLVVQILNVVYNEMVAAKNFVDYKSLGIISTISVMILCVFMPFTFTLYWAIVKVVDYAIYIYTMVFNKAKTQRKIEEKMKITKARFEAAEARVEHDKNVRKKKKR